MRNNYGVTGVSGITYDGVALSDYFEIVDISVPLLPTFEAVTQGLAQRAGEYFNARKVGTRTITIKLRLNAQSINPTDIWNAWNNLASLFSKKEPKALELCDGKRIYCIPTGETPIDMHAYYGDVEFQFVAYDPYFYGATHEINLEETTTFDVLGDEVFPILELKATDNLVTVSNVNTGDYVKIPNLSNGSRVVIDMEKQVSTVYGAYAPVYLESDYFSIEGTAKIKLTNCTGKLKYTERFL